MLNLRGLIGHTVGHAVTGVHHGDCSTDATLQFADCLLDFFCGGLCAFRQIAYFIGNHGKPTPLLPCPGRLDGGVESEKIGLLGNGLDHIQDLADGAAVTG
ncbi:hypothetical protein D9M71_831990 [compost metagenome]